MATTKMRLIIWLTTLPMAVTALAVFPSNGGPTLCPFALLTGMACPGCGMTRAGAALVRGDLVAAWEFHPLIVLVATWLAGAWLVALLRERGSEVRIPVQIINRLLNLTGLALILTWLVRMMTGALPPV